MSPECALRHRTQSFHGIVISRSTGDGNRTGFIGELVSWVRPPWRMHPHALRSPPGTERIGWSSRRVFKQSSETSVANPTDRPGIDDSPLLWSKMLEEADWHHPP